MFALALAVTWMTACNTDVIYGPLDSRIVGDWTSLEPDGQTLSVDADFNLQWTGTDTAVFAAGSAGTPDAITLPDGTQLTAVGATNENGTIDDGETFSSTDSSTTLTFSGGTAELQQTASARVTVYSTWSESAGSLTLTASDSGRMSGTTVTISRSGMAAVTTAGFAITPGTPHTLAFLGHTLVAEGDGDTLTSGSPWTFTSAAGDRKLRLDVTDSTLQFRDTTCLPPGSGSSSGSDESHGTVLNRRHDYDGSSLTGTLELHHRSPDGDYSVEELDGGVRRLTLWNLDSDVAPFTTVRTVAGTAREITFEGARWFRNGGSAQITGPWSDGGDGIVTFNADGTWELDPGDGGALRHGHWRQSGSRVYICPDEVYER